MVAVLFDHIINFKNNHYGSVRQYPESHLRNRGQRVMLDFDLMLSQKSMLLCSAAY